MSTSPQPTPPLAHAKQAGLLYVTDESPGLSRRRSGRGFMYFDVEGAHIKDGAVKERIKALAIPPAWTDVWICPSPRCHLQATGRDDAGRKQYIYHERWGEVRNETKFSQMVEFARSLPEIRRRYDKDMRQRELNQSRVLGIVVRFLDLAMLRVGNEANVREDGGHGLTTLTTEHVDVSTTSIEVDFVGKGGQDRHLVIRDRRLASQISRCMEIGGFHLFDYIDTAGKSHRVDSTQVNDYLREITGQPYTAKYFRTWGGTRAAARSLLASPRPDDEKGRKAAIKRAIKAAADALGNTIAVSRKYYIHPDLFEAYQTCEDWPLITDESDSPSLPDLSPVEHFVLRLLGRVEH